VFGIEKSELDDERFLARLRRPGVSETRDRAGKGTWGKWGKRRKEGSLDRYSSIVLAEGYQNTITDQ
jgi:hypothetical protein